MKCSFSGCQTPGIRLIDGQPFCPTHYDQLLRERFSNSYQAWGGSGENLGDLKYNFARYVGETRQELLINGLSTARIRDRGESYTKTDFGLTFVIIRHPGAWTKEHGKEVRQVYAFYLEPEKLELVSEEKTGKMFFG